MKITQIMATLKELAKSQGLYERIYNELRSYEQYDKEVFEAIKADLEAKNFNDVIDLIMFIEG